MALSVVTILLGGLAFPITAAVMGFVNCLGRFFYLAYISSKGASHPLRVLGVLMIDVAIITNVVFSFIVAVKLLKKEAVYWKKENKNLLFYFIYFFLYKKNIAKFFFFFFFFSWNFIFKYS